MSSTTKYHLKITLGSLLLTVMLAASSVGYADTQTRTSAFDYDAATGLLTKEIIEPDDANACLVTTYTYDGYGNKTSATTRNCNGSAGSIPASNSEAAVPAAGSAAIITTRSSNTSYDANGQFPVSSTNALGQTETKTWNADYGTPQSLTGPNGLTTNWTYDTFGRQLTEARADGTSTQTSYALCTTGCSSGAQYSITTTTAGTPPATADFDMLGRPLQTSTVDKDGNWVQASLKVYDHLGHLSKQSQPARAGGTLTWTTTTFDTLGRALSATAPDGTTSNMSYAGLSSTVTNAKGQTKIEVHNTQGQLIGVTDTAGKTLTYNYDTYSNLLATVDTLGNVTTITYDKRGRKTAMSDPDQGNWSYQYDALGQLIQQTDAKGQVVTFTYDVLGRMLTRNEPDLKSTWAYDTCDATLNPGGKCIGKPVKESTDNGYVRTYLYDALGRATAELDNVGTNYGVTKSFDAYGRVSALAYPGSGLNVYNVYSSSGYLTEVHNASTSALYWQLNTTDAAGRTLKETYGNGVVTNHTYDVMGRITQISAGGSSGMDLTTNTALSGAASISNQSFVYDSIGNINQRYDGVTGLNESFGYDNLNRLIATSAQAGAGPLTQTTLTYNAIGNIITKSDVGTYNYTSINANGVVRPHAVSQIMMNDGVTVYGTYSYDANGNQTSGAGRTITWNSWNMPTTIVGTGKNSPTGVTSSTFGFVYNASHERVKETLPNGTVVYNISPRVDTGIHVEKRVATDGTTTYLSSLYAGGMPFGTDNTVFSPTNVKTETTSYYHTDHLGSVIAISDQSGNVTERRSYDAWGKHRNLNGTSMNNAFVTPAERHGFAGQEELDDVGLVHMNGRLYDPSTGRFLSADPTIQYASNMQNYNRYSYINNNPLSTVDLSGYGFFDDFFDTLGGAVGGLVGGFVDSVKAALSVPLIRTVASIAAAVYLPGSQAFINAGLTGISGQITAGFVSGFIGSGGHLKGAFVGAFTAGAFNVVGGLGQTYNLAEGGIAKILLHGLVGCASSALGGGKCGSGALAAGFTQAFAPTISGIDSNNLGPNLYRTIAAAVVGGTASVLGGGKFENGAITGAFSRLFNDDATNHQRRQEFRMQADKMAQDDLIIGSLLMGGVGLVRETFVVLSKELVAISERLLVTNVTKVLVNVEEQGGIGAAERLFDSLPRAGAIETTPTDRGLVRSVKLEGGGTASIRPFSETNPSGATVQINIPNSRTIKIRYD